MLTKTLIHFLPTYGKLWLMVHNCSTGLTNGNLGWHRTWIFNRCGLLFIVPSYLSLSFCQSFFSCRGNTALRESNLRDLFPDLLKHRKPRLTLKLSCWGGMPHSIKNFRHWCPRVWVHHLRNNLNPRIESFWVFEFALIQLWRQLRLAVVHSWQLLCEIQWKANE